MLWNTPVPSQASTSSSPDVAVSFYNVNKTERAIERVGKAIGTIAPLLQHFDMETNIKQVSGTHKGANMDKYTELVVNELLKHEIFFGRKHRTFSSPKDLLRAKYLDDLQEWMVYRLKKVVHTTNHKV